MKRSLLFRFLFFLFLRLHTPFLSLPYAGVYTLLDNRVQGCLGLLLCSWQPHQPSSLKSHPTFGAELNILPPFGEACVCNPWNHRDPFGFVQFFSTEGGLVVHASTSPTKRLALNTDIGGDAHRRTCTFSNGFPNGMRLSPEPHSADCARAIAVNLSDSSLVFPFPFWAILPLKTPRFRSGSLLVLLGNGTLGRRVAPQSSQYAYP